MVYPIGSEHIAASELTKMDFVNILPPEVSLNIFSYLNSQELTHCCQINKAWKVLASDDALWNALPPPKIAFGKKEWNTYLGDIGKEPLYPKDIHKILKNPCPFWPEKTIEETHILVLIPETVNGEPLTLSALKKLVKGPKKGHPTTYQAECDLIMKEHAHRSIAQSHWVLMTKNILPGSKDKSYLDQHAFIAKVAEYTGMNYEVPSILEATICILMHYIRSGERLFNTDGPWGYTRILWTYTRCQEKIHDHQILVGGFSSDGLILNRYVLPFNFGVAALRKFL